MSRSTPPPAPSKSTHYAVMFEGQLICLNDSREHADSIARLFGAGFSVAERDGPLPASVRASVDKLNRQLDQHARVTGPRPALRLIRGGRAG